MKKLSPVVYRTLFLKHVWRFLQTVTTPLELKGHHVVAVSGGIDSMTALWVANTFYKEGKIGKVRAVFVHHQTRATQDDDQALIEKFCKQENIELTVLSATGLSAEITNFEEKARRLRRQLIVQNLVPEECLWTGHHIDDSYEWNMMQKHRSNNIKSMLGIPVRNGPIVRPFNCVTRSQLTRVAKFEGIPWREDPTNKDIKFDRNYIRHKVIPAIKKRYPRYLRHYVHLSNFSAMMLNMSMINKIHGSKMYIYDNGAIMEGSHFSEIQIQELIHVLSNTNRGEIISQIVKMIRAIDNGKKGPFHFSGGVEAYATFHQLMLYKRDFKNHDESVSRALALLSIGQMKLLPTFTRAELEMTWNNLLKSSEAMMDLPGLVVVLESDSVLKTLNTSVYDSLFPNVSAVCKAKNLRFMTAVKCIEMWKLKSNKLPGKLRLIPLWNLANLFPSQE